MSDRNMGIFFKLFIINIWKLGYHAHKLLLYAKLPKEFVSTINLKLCSLHLIHEIIGKIIELLETDRVTFRFIFSVGIGSIGTSSQMLQYIMSIKRSNRSEH